MDEQGRLLVDFPGNRAGPRVARRPLSLEPAALREAIVARQAAVRLFENEEPGLPLVVDIDGRAIAIPLQG